MSVCDVPLCTSVSIGVSHGAMSASKGVSRSSNVNETRDRLRIRLHQRKLHASTAQKSIEKYPFNPDITYSVQSGPLAKPKNDKADIPKPTKVLKTSTNTPLLLEENLQITKMMKNLDISMPKVKATTKKGETKEQLVDTKVQKDKENKQPQQVAAAPVNPGQQHNIYKTDIDELIKFIEGKDYEIAQKKAAKKARQKEKKDEEKRKHKAEEERKRRAEHARLMEEKRKEEERLKAEQAAKDAAIKKAAKKKLQQQLKQQQQQQAKKNESKTKKKKKPVPQAAAPEPELLEETIPAMVTIKRIVENNNSPPTVTITLKGSTPDQDKLLYTLVNGHNNRNGDKTVELPVPKKEEPKAAQSKKKKKKKKKEAEKAKAGAQTKPAESREESVITSEMKVTLSVDKSFRKELEAKVIHKVESTKRTIIQEVPKLSCDKSKMRETLIDIPSLKLPPGITITKVTGPLQARKPPNVQASAEYNGVPVSKSGVIVVDTEKLIQQSSGKKTKKKKKKSQEQQQQPDKQQSQQLRQNSCNNRCNRRNQPADEADMVTLKNPIFQKFQNKIVSKPPDAVPPIIDMNEQATISKGANGMVTIRRPRPMTLQNESPISDFLKPVIHSSGIETKSTLSDDRKIIRPPSPRATHATNHYDYELSRLSAQNILWGLPGIQITKVNKNGNFTEFTDHSEQAADVSIIRTGGFNLDKDDWPYGKFNLA